MKIWVVIEAINEPEWGGTSAKLEARAYPSEEHAGRDLGVYSFEIDHRDAFCMFPGIFVPTFEKRGRTPEYKAEVDNFTKWFNGLVHYYAARQSAIDAKRGMEQMGSKITPPFKQMMIQRLTYFESLKPQQPDERTDPDFLKFLEEQL